MATKAKKAETPEDRALAALALTTEGPDDAPADPDLVIDENGQVVDDDLTFTTPDLEEDEEPRETAVFEVDGVKYTATQPSDGEWSMLLASLDPHATIGQRTNATLSFIQACVDPGGWMQLHHRLTTPDDPFDVNMLANIVAALITRWGKDKAGNRAQRRATRTSKRRR